MEKFRQQFGSILLLAFSFSMTGCYACLDEIQETEMHMLNHCRAHKAWWRNKDCYGDLDHKCHFSKGFRDGYMAAAVGGDICLPNIPPRKYWGVCYQSESGRVKTNSWFEGFAHGTLVAAQDGVYFDSQLATMGLDSYEHSDAYHSDHEVYMEEDLKNRLLPAPTPIEEPMLYENENNKVPAPSYDPPMTGHSGPAPRGLPVPAPGIEVELIEPVSNTTFDPDTDVNFEPIELPALPEPQVQNEGFEQESPFMQGLAGIRTTFHQSSPAQNDWWGERNAVVPAQFVNVIQDTTEWE